MSMKTLSIGTTDRKPKQNKKPKEKKKMKIVKLKINLSKIDKERLFKGAKGTYLDATAFLEDAEDQYGNHGMISQDVSKEERVAGNKGPILGNVKVVWEGESRPAPAATSAPATAPVSDDTDGDEIPF